MASAPEHHDVSFGTPTTSYAHPGAESKEGTGPPAFVVYHDFTSCNLVYAAPAGGETLWLPLPPATDLKSVRLRDALTGRSAPYVLRGRPATAAAAAVGPAAGTAPVAVPAAGAVVSKAVAPAAGTDTADTWASMMRGVRDAAAEKLDNVTPCIRWLRYADDAAPATRLRLTYRTASLTYTSQASLAVRPLSVVDGPAAAAAEAAATGARRKWASGERKRVDSHTALREGVERLTAPPEEEKEAAAAAAQREPEPAWRAPGLWEGELELLAVLSLRNAPLATEAWRAFAAAPVRLVDAAWAPPASCGARRPVSTDVFGHCLTSADEARRTPDGESHCAPERDSQWTMRRLPAALWLDPVPAAAAGVAALAKAMAGAGPSEAAASVSHASLARWRLAPRLAACVVRAHASNARPPSCGYEAVFALPRALPAGCAVEVFEAETGEALASAHVDPIDGGRLRVLFERASCVSFGPCGVRRLPGANVGPLFRTPYGIPTHHGPVDISPQQNGGGAAQVLHRFRLTVTNALTRPLHVQVAVDTSRAPPDPDAMMMMHRVPGSPAVDDSALEWEPAPVVTTTHRGGGGELVWSVDLPAGLAHDFEVSALRRRDDNAAANNAAANTVGYDSDYDVD